MTMACSDLVIVNNRGDRSVGLLRGLVLGLGVCGSGFLVFSIFRALHLKHSETLNPKPYYTPNPRSPKRTRSWAAMWATSSRFVCSLNVW